MLPMETVQLVITGVVIGAAVMSIPTFAYLKKKGINVGVKLTTIEKDLDNMN